MDYGKIEMREHHDAMCTHEATIIALKSQLAALEVETLELALACEELDQYSPANPGEFRLQKALAQDLISKLLEQKHET